MGTNHTMAMDSGNGYVSGHVWLRLCIVYLSISLNIYLHFTISFAMTMTMTMRLTTDMAMATASGHGYVSGHVRLRWCLLFIHRYRYIRLAG